ncbi:AbrB family transcriptional regulator [Cereibacter sp. SYSU M97828]|nr:AbrB family transcriptional regulator [Cereibacter flavus]
MAPGLRAPVVLLVGATGGFLFHFAHLPLPWTLGAMAAATLLSTFAPRMTLPAVFRDGARPVIGVAAGSAFTPAVVAALPQWWPVLIMLTGFFLVTSGLGRVFFKRIGLDRQTAYLASSPGGLGEMTLLGIQMNADIRALVLIHTIRIIMVVTVLPFALRSLFQIDFGIVRPHVAAAAPWDWLSLLGCGIVGYVLGRPFRRMGGITLVPLMLSAALHGGGLVTAAPPSWLIAGMQVVIGCITGARLGGLRLAELRRFAASGVIWALTLILMALTLASVAAPFLGTSRAALFLALAPGGFAEMTVVAIAMNVEVAFVVTCHVFRIFYVLAVSPALCRRAMRDNR